MATPATSSLTREQKLAQLKRFFEDTPPVGSLLSTLRSRRIARGYSVDSGKPEVRSSSGNSVLQERSPLSFVSDHEPMPLSDVEEALLAWAACGPNGMVHWDIAVHGGFHELTWLAGRTMATPGNSHSTDLLIVNDNGVFIYKPDQEREAIVEIRGESDYDKVLRWYDEYTTQVLDHRPNFDYGTRIPGCPNSSIAGPYQYNLNREGTTWYMPLLDVGYLYFSILLNFFDAWHLALVDEDGTPAGVGPWMEEGKLEFPVTISQYELFMFQEEQYPTGLATQNLRLAAECMGLGNWIFGGYFDDVLMGAFPQVTPGLGFRHAELNPKAPIASGALKTFGVEGVKEGIYVPGPRFSNGQEVIDHMLADKYTKGMTLSQGDDNWMLTHQGPFKPEIARDIINMAEVNVSDWAREAAIAYVDYCVDKYGQCPVYFNPLQCNMATVVHHVDEAFYEQFYNGSTSTPQLRDHMQHWH